MSLTDLFAKNLAHAESGLSGGKAVRHAIGKGVIKGIGGMLQHGDQALGAGADALFSHGGPVAEGAGNILSSGFDALKSAPPAAKALAVGVPAYYYLRDRDANSLVEPMFNNYIEEGRTVTSSKKNKYADTDAFLEKQAGFLDFIMSPGIQHTVETAGKAIGEGGGAGKILEHLGGAAGHFRQAAQPALGAAQQAMHSSAGRGLLMGAGGLGLGAALAGAGSLLKPALSGMSGTGAYQLNRSMNSLPDRIQADELFAKTYVTGMASSAAQATASLLKDMAEKAMGAVSPQPDSSAMLEALTQSDPILRRGDQAVMLDAYHTMAKFAPTLATDENAVRSFLREAVVSGSGPDYASISNLAKAEDAVRKAQSPLKTAGVNPELPLNILKGMLSHGATGAAIGAGAGALGDKNDRTRGALRGALIGGLAGVPGGMLHGAANDVASHMPVLEEIHRNSVIKNDMNAAIRKATSEIYGTSDEVAKLRAAEGIHETAERMPLRASLQGSARAQRDLDGIRNVANRVSVLGVGGGAATSNILGQHTSAEENKPLNRLKALLGKRK